MTPGGQWAQLIGSMMGQGNEQMLQKQQMDTSKDQKQQQLDMEKQAQLRQQQQADQEFAEHMQSLGAKPVINGVVKRPDTYQIPGLDKTFNFDRLDQAGTDGRTVIGHKTAEGDKVQWELPTLHEQILNQWNAGSEQRAGQAQQAGVVQQAESYGKTAGQNQAADVERNTNAIPLTPQQRQQYGIPEGVNVSTDDLLRHIYRPYSQLQGVQARVEGANDRNDANIDARQSLADSKQQFTDEQNARKLDYQNRWAAARNAIVGQTQNSLNNRALLHQFDAQQKQHGALLDQTYKEQQKALEAQPLLDPKATPDGAEFVDPWSGKKQTMNYAQRLRMQNGMNASTQQVQGWQQRADSIAQKFGLNGQQPAQGGTPQQPAKPAQQPAQKPGSTPKVATSAQVQAYAKKKGIDVAAATKEFTGAGYKVQ